MSLPEGETNEPSRELSSYSPASAESSKKADDLTDMEKARKREENARRRKLQADQKQENDKVRRRSPEDVRRQ